MMTLPPPKRLQMMLLAGIVVLLVAFVVRVKPMQAEIDEALMSMESGSTAPAEPPVSVPDAAYAQSAELALPRFYDFFETQFSASELKIDSRQARIESDPSKPASELIYEARVRGRWPAVMSFVTGLRAARPRIRVERVMIHRTETSGEVELFFEARALAIATPS